MNREIITLPNGRKAFRGIVLDDLSDAESEEMIARGKACADQFKGVNEKNRKVLAASLPVRELLPGRNDPCGCGSGKKFKKCCGK